VRSAKNKKIHNTRTGGAGQSVMPNIETALLPLTPVKKISAKKIFGSNLLLLNRLLVSTPTKPYASLREARQNFSEKTLRTQLVEMGGIGRRSPSLFFLFLEE
jgi:hypothetical protein